MPTLIESPSKKHSPKRNRAAGHRYETDTAKRLREIGFEHAVTSRSENRARDGQKVDLCNKDEYKNGRLQYNLQCKCEASPVSYIKLLDQLPQEKPYIDVVLHRKTVKSSGGKFMVKGEYAIMHQEDFFDLIGRLLQYQKNDSTN